MIDIPHDHHYVPQFFLRNFALDEERGRLTTVGKNGSMAIWAERSIKNLGYERDLYVHLDNGVPVSVENEINHRIEIPISQSDTWKKIASGRTDALDQSDRPILYALIRHLEARAPRFRNTVVELSQMAADPNSSIPFSKHECSMYALMRDNPDTISSKLNLMAATTEWTTDSYRGALLVVLRSPIPIRTTTAPVFLMPTPYDPRISLPLPGMTPYQMVLTLNPYTIACLTLGDFDGAFINQSIDIPTAAGFNRHFLGQFSKFDDIRHLITNRDNIVTDMTWAPYELVRNTEKKIIFRRRENT